MKTYTITERGQQFKVQSTSIIKALANHFGCERPVRCMSGNEWGNMRYSKGNAAAYRSAKIQIDAE